MNSLTSIKVAFDYNLLTEDFQGTLIAVADRIKSRVRRQTADIIEIGRDLLTIKSEMEHGLFLKWVAAEFRWSARTAQRYMQAAEWAGAKYDTVSYLPPTLIYALADKNTPEHIKSDVKVAIAAGRPIDISEIQEKIFTERERQRMAKRGAKSADDPAPPPIEKLAEIEVTAEPHIFDQMFGPLNGAEWMQLREDCWRRPIKRGRHNRPGHCSDEFMKLVAHFKVPLADLEAAE